MNTRALKTLYFLHTNLQKNDSPTAMHSYIVHGILKLTACVYYIQHLYLYISIEFSTAKFDNDKE